MANEGKYLNLKPHVPSWSIFNVNGPYQTAYRIGTLAPIQFGGLSYQILEDKGGYVYIIQTESFGRVAIWAGDSDSTITSSPAYTSGASLPMGSTGKYLNLKPHVPSWSIYHVNGPYNPADRIGTLAPIQFGGLSYPILEEKGNHVYVIQTESFGRVAIWAGDSDSTFSSTPLYTDIVNGGGSNIDTTGGTGQYVNLHAHVPDWTIYNVGGPYTPQYGIGKLAPAQYGGLSYAILGNPMTDVYLIQTESFGQVAIWVGDSDGSVTGRPLYGAGSYTGGTSGATGGTFVNLSPTQPSWSVYNVHGPYQTAYRIGTLAPSQYGGLSYRILESLGNHVYIIQTESFGKVAIWAGDSDSTFTSYPLYGESQPSVPGVDLGNVSFPDSVGIVPREVWGAQPMDLPRMDGPLTVRKYIVIHHEAGTQPQIGTDYEKMRAIQNMHRNRPDLLWGDIGYHYGIGQHGTVMEGRPIGWQGAHVGQPHNKDSIGICLFGNFMNAMPTEKQMSKLIPLLVQLCKSHGISPDNILGHRDMDSNYGYTSCPGDYFYSATKRLQDIRNAVKKKLLGEAPISLAEKKQHILEEMKAVFRKVPFFNIIPFNINMWEEEYRKTLTPNIDMVVKLSLGTESPSPVSKLLTVNITKPKIELESPLFDLFKEQKMDDINFYDARSAMENLAGELEGKGNVVLSLGADGDKIYHHYTVHFNSTTFPDGTSLESTCRITLEVDNTTFVTPDKNRENVPNETYTGLVGQVNPSLAEQAFIITALAVLAAMTVMSGGSGTPYTVPAALLLTANL